MFFIVIHVLVDGLIGRLVRVLTTNLKVTGLFPGIDVQFLKSGLNLERGSSSLMRTIGKLLDKGSSDSD